MELTVESAVGFSSHRRLFREDRLNGSVEGNVDGERYDVGWRRETRSWLMRKNPPTRAVSGEYKLWWYVIRQAAKDLRYSYTQNALDALEFLRSTGLWLSVELFGIPPEEYKTEITDLLLRSRSLEGIRKQSTFLQL